MKVKVTDDCIGCGACVAICPAVFEMDTDKMKSRVKKQPAKGDEKLVKDAVSACPVSAIKLS
jgi:ferredoxin